MTLHPHCYHQTLDWYRLCPFKRMASESKKEKNSMITKGKENISLKTKRKKANIWKWLFMRSRWRLKETSAWWHLKYGLDGNHGWEAPRASVYKSSLSFPDHHQMNKRKYGRLLFIGQKNQEWDIKWRQWGIPHKHFPENVIWDYKN